MLYIYKVQTYIAEREREREEEEIVTVSSEPGRVSSYVNSRQEAFFSERGGGG